LLRRCFRRAQLCRRSTRTDPPPAAGVQAEKDAGVVMQTKSIAVVVAALALGLPARADPVVVVNSGSQSTLVPLSPSSPGATGTSTIIPINVTATDPLGLTDPLLGQLGLTDPLLGQPSSVVPLPDVIVTGGISGTTAPADGSGLYSYTASVGSPVS